MIVYLDTSAFVPLLVTEPTTEACGELWDSADAVVTTRLTYVETVAALAMATRRGRLGEAGLKACRRSLDDLWSQLDVLELDPRLMSVAADLAVAHGLRGYDATHCAAALSIADDELVATSGDRHLLAAWTAEGVAVRDPRD